MPQNRRNCIKKTGRLSAGVAATLSMNVGAPHLYTTLGDLDKFMRAIEKLSRSWLSSVEKHELRLSFPFYQDL